MQIIPFTDTDTWLQNRSQDITSTEVSALFGLSPYLTEFELYWRKKNKIYVTIEQTVRMKWGTRLQDSIAKGIAEDNTWSIRPMTEYIRDPELRLGASFDYNVNGTGILEIKNVDSLQFKEGWLIDGDNLEAPPHIELQVQTQLAISRLSYAYIGALIGGNNVKLIKREPNQKIIDSIKTRVSNFWANVESGKEPLPNFEKDAEFISSIYNRSEKGKILDISGDETFTEIAKKYKENTNEIKRLNLTKDALKAEMLIKINDAEKAIGNGFSISAGIIPSSELSFKREEYRSFKVNWKKEK